MPWLRGQSIFQAKKAYSKSQGCMKMVNKNNLVTMVLKLAEIKEKMVNNCYFIDEQELKWGNYISFKELRIGRENPNKYMSIKYESKRHKEVAEKERKAREEIFPRICSDIKIAGRVLQEAEMLGYNKIPDFRKLTLKLEGYVKKIKNRREKKKFKK